MNIGDMQRKLSQKAQGTPEHKFQDLYGLLLSDGWLLLAHDYVAQNAGSVTAGCDGVDMAYFDEDLWGNLQKIAKDLRSGDFEPYPVRRVYKAVPYKGQFHKPNPYLTQAVITRENLPQDQAWAGYEARPGQADLKLLALKRDGSVCRDCKVPVTESTSHLHHLREVRFFKNPVDANTLPNVVVLCIPCHQVRTEIRRQQLESRVR